MMQLGDTTTTTTTDTAPSSGEAAETSGGGAVGMKEVDGGFGGNRWPRQETLALLKIRSEMDVVFRDATVKTPLWEEVSRKLVELGYHRSAKKCKEKFENVYKYHKRTKDGRTGKSESKTYRFFDQLEALENRSSSTIHQSQQQTSQNPLNNSTLCSGQPPLQPPPQPPLAATVLAGAQLSTVSSSLPSFPPLNSISGDFHWEPTSSSSTSSDIETRTRRRRKRNWKEFFGRMIKQVVEKQEELQSRFLETMEKREHERMVREEAWRTQEMARITREQEILAQERSMAADKDAVLLAFLQKLSETQNSNHSRQPLQPPLSQQQPPQPAAPPPPPQPVAVTVDISKRVNGNQSLTPAGLSRWPKTEIEALIKLRTNLDAKYQGNGTKGVLWEEISAKMRRLGYNRSAKRCKEKWENINKYYKKVKQSDKKRSEDSKSCTYFHQLDVLYRTENKSNFSDHIISSSSSSGHIKPENTVPLVVQPEQQWPPLNPGSENQADLPMEDIEGKNFDREPDGDGDGDGDGEEEEEEEEEEDGEDGGGAFEVVPNNNKTVYLGTSG